MAQRSGDRGEMTNARTMQSELLKIFRRINRREGFEIPSVAALKANRFRAIVSASISKCLQLNTFINQAKNREITFLFIANLRGIAEELIFLQFLSTFGHTDREKLIDLIHVSRLHDGLLAQVKFFGENNPFQPVVGGKPVHLQSLRASDRAKLRAFWAGHGESKKDGPSIRDMAERTGLIHTYEYIYYLSSNFVHFNPNILMRMGWGPEFGPYRFSVSNFSQYYGDVASFYGAVLFIGFYYRLGLG